MVYKAGVDSTLFAISQENFDEVIGSHPRILYGLLKNAYAPIRKTPTNKPMPQKKLVQKTEEGTIEESAKVEIETKPKETDKLTIKEAKKPDKPILNGPTVMSTGVFPQGHKGYPGITHPEYDKLLFDKEYTCPYCGKSFEAKKVFNSKLAPDGPMRYDLRKNYVGFNATWYDIITCPHCYFSMFEDTFNDPSKLHKKLVKEIVDGFNDQVILNFDVERDIEYVFATHYLAAECSEGYGAKTQIMMKIWANLSWLYEDVSDKDMELMAAGKCAEFSEKLFIESTKLSPVQEQLVCLSVAGMLYRAGKEGAMKWLFDAKTARGGKPAYAELAERLMDKIKEEEDAGKKE